MQSLEEEILMMEKEKEENKHWSATRKHKFIILMVTLVLLILVGLTVYVNIYYHADENAKACMADGYNNKVTVTVNDDKSIVFAPASEKTDTGLIFYPGGKVEYTAYAPLIEKIAEKGIKCILVKMPCNLAVLDRNAADNIVSKQPEIKNWYIGGHSLGGTMAAYYVGSHEREFKGLILLAAYSTKNISHLDIKTESIYGSMDGVLDLDKYANNVSNLPSLEEKIIEGGCHSFFGDYGLQSGDGQALITRNEQQTKTASYIDKFIKETNQ